ncbi:MAG: hypothetical protein SFV19_05555 [Rhodospirillaceae bacterium]|nr:hypothetical protein [Rhodospirillaceae bacterium]
MSAVLKFLLIAAVIFVAFWVVKFRGRVSFAQTVKNTMAAAKKSAQDIKAAIKDPASTSTPTSTVPTKLVACPKCGTFLAEGATCTCGKS